MEPSGLGHFVMYAGWLLALIAVIGNFILNARRKPSIESEFATKQELYRVEGQLISKIDKVEGKGEANHENNQNMFNIIMRSMGGVEQGIKDLQARVK